MVCIELDGLLLTPEERLQRYGRHCAEPLADETVQEEVDGGVEQCQHVGHIGDNVDRPAVVDGRDIKVVKDHDNPRGPEDGENGGDDKQDGGGFPGGIASQPEVALLSKPVDDDGVQDEEDGAGDQIDGEAVDPDEDVVNKRTCVVFLPDVRPPVIWDAGQKANNINTHNDFAGASGIGNHVVFEGMTDGDVPVDRERDSNPDGSMDGGEL